LDQSILICEIFEKLLKALDMRYLACLSVNH